MDTIGEFTTTDTIKTLTEKHLNSLLADEYILMNKTITFLCNLIPAPSKEMIEQLYDDLKTNVDKIKQLLKARKAVSNLSITSFLTNTGLQTDIKSTSPIPAFEMLIADHDFIQKSITGYINEPEEHGDDVIQELVAMNKIHTTIKGRLRFYLRSLTN
jgi:DNA-binding ferritin-like protein